MNVVKGAFFHLSSIPRAIKEGTFDNIQLENTQFFWRIHSFSAENTQVECWRIHSFYYRKSLKEPENTQIFGEEQTSLMLENTHFTIQNPLRNMIMHSVLVENTQV